jgi:hypothetical protein
MVIITEADRGGRLTSFCRGYESFVDKCFLPRKESACDVHVSNVAIGCDHLRELFV